MGANRTNSFVSARVFELTDVNAVVTLSGMTITGGKVVEVNDKGGGIYAEGDLTLSNYIVTDNIADSGGAIYSGFLLRLEGSSIINNRAVGTGDGTVAGIYVHSVIQFTNSTISGNRNVNSPPNSAGGLYIENVAFFDSLIRATTITDNAAAGAGSAGGIFSKNGFADMYLYNSIVAGNVNNVVTPDVAGSFKTFGYNLIGNRGAVVFAGDHDQSGLSGSPLNPSLASLNFYGGTMPTHTLLGNSPALDKGSTTLSNGEVPTDQRGFTRPVDIPAIPNDDIGVDIGAFEARNTLIVNKTADTNDGNCSPTDCSLREAIAAATPGSIVYFSSLFDTPQTITLNSGELVINKNLDIIGTGANLLTVSGNNSRVFNITFGKASLSGMKINGGFLNGSGGGILNNGILTLANSVISDNSTSSGAGISNTDILTVTNSTVSNNQVLFGNQTGGGIENTGSRLTINNSTISGNNIPDGNNSGNNHGGGIWTGNNSAVIIINSTITNNTATGAGSTGGIYRENGTVTIRNSIIADNVSNTTKPDVVSSGGTGITSNGFNLIGNRGSVTFSGAGDQSGTGASPLNPQIGALQNNGGTTPTHALMINSPALDKGHSSGSTTDQRGFFRPVDFSAVNNVGDGADIGAFEVQAPTAASVTIGGRVFTPVGRGLRNALVTLTDQNGNNQTALTTTFGYYRFADVAAGETCVISVNSKQYQFAPQVVSVTEELNNLNFTAQQ